MVVPWNGFELADLLELAGIKSQAKFVAFETLYRPEEMRGQRMNVLDWPYVEGLRIDEALHPLSMIATGIYGRDIPNQNGAPLRLVVPWKYGFKSIKSIVRVHLTDKQPPTSWNIANPSEYGFYSNVNPGVDHPRWSQFSERPLGGGLFAKRVPTLMFNGYSEDVAHLYKGMNLRKFFLTLAWHKLGAFEGGIILLINSAIRSIPIWSIYFLGFLPAVWFFFLGFSNQLGPNPITKLEHLLGEFALQILILGLSISPIRRFTSINLMKFRRSLGLLAFSYVALHLLVWLFLDVRILSQIWADIIKRPYITIGMLSFMAMLPLVLTSNQKSMKWLGRNWFRLHKLTYLVCLLGAVHFVMVRKGFQLEPLIYLSVISLLLLARIIPNLSR